MPVHGVRFVGWMVGQQQKPPPFSLSLDMCACQQAATQQQCWQATLTDNPTRPSRWFCDLTWPGFAVAGTTHVCALAQGSKSFFTTAASIECWWLAVLRMEASHLVACKLYVSPHNFRGSTRTRTHTCTHLLESHKQPPSSCLLFSPHKTGTTILHPTVTHACFEWPKSSER